MDMKLLYLPLLLGYEFSVCICWSHSLGTAMPLLHTDTGCLGAVWIHGHADRVHVSILINEACPEASLGIRTACCGTARVGASSPSGLQMEAAVVTLPASDGQPAAFTARLCLEAALEEH